MYKPRQTVDWFYMETNNVTPKSTTHEMLEMGQAKQKICRKVSKKELNFQTYGMNDFRFDNLITERPKKIPITTSYQRDYDARYTRCAKASPEKLADEIIPDQFWNRKPLNDFSIERITSSEFMFMDDHLINVTEQRKKANFLRQIKNQHHPLA